MDDVAALGPAERQQLLVLARTSIAASLAGEEMADDAPGDCPAIFREERATFVTLKAPDHRGHLTLRGCIGTMEPAGSLYRSVFRNARQSAFHDSRFNPVQEDELERIQIEISVLTPLLPVDSAAEIVPGRDGVRLRLKGAGAVFLPQVATEYGWDRTTLLEKLCNKAGLSSSSWKKAELAIFQAIVFGEPD
jgi:AmmeMemoRadiSam system protein A